MCPFNSRRFLVAFFIAISVFGAYGQSHFTFTANTGDNMTVLVQAAINPVIDGSAIANGDEIGVFTPAGLCVGAVAWNGVNTALAVWGDNDQTVPIDGCVAGELLSYKVWDASAAKEAPATVAYASGGPDYSVDGMAVLASLSATTPPSTPILNSPTDAAANQLTSLTLSWNTATGAATYHVQVSTSNIFASILLEDSTLVTTSRAVTGLSNNTVYYWRVRAKNAGGVSAWASAWSFTTIIAAPAVPLLALPTDATTGQTLSPTLSWNTATGAATYHVQVSTSNIFASILLEDSTLVTTSRAVTGLSNNTVYYWRVRAKNAGGVSAWASAWSFTTIIAAPAVPLLALPTDATTGQTLSPTLSWNTATGAATYHVQVSTSNIFASILLEDSTLVTTSRAVTGLSNNTVYYWRVRAKNAGGVSAWASAWSFTTIIAAPAVPLLALPTDATTGQTLSPTLSWNTATGAATYHVQVSTSNIFASILLEDSTLVTTSRAVTGLSNNTVYYWRVRAKNAGGVSAWASAWSFTTIIAAPAVPLLALPTDATTGQTLSPTLSWNTATGAATYHVQVSTSNIFASILLEDSTLVTTSRAVTGLSNNTVYYWRVRAKNAGGVSAWASAWSFTTIIAAPAVPLLALPTDATTGQTLSPTLSWNTATGAATYHVQVSTSNIFASILLEDSTLVTTSRAVTGLSNNTVYYWRVRAKNAGGVSAWASAWSFTTIIAAPAVPLLALPTDATTGQTLSPPLSWNTATGAATYHVQVSTSNIFASILLEDSTLVTTSRAVTGLSNSAVYYWRVRAKNAGGVSAWASAWSFTTIIAAPAVPLLTLPANGATGQSASPTLSWNTVTGAATYHVQVSTSNPSASILLKDSTLTATSKTITGLDNNLTHYWRVRAKNAGNVSAWASPWSFATAKIGLFPVSAGWNMISLNIPPQDSSAGALLGPLHGIVLSKNNLGQIYWPAYGINTIGNLATGPGYTLYTDSVDTIRTWVRVSTRFPRPLPWPPGGT